MLCMACPVGRQPLQCGPPFVATHKGTTAEQPFVAPWVTPPTRCCRLAIDLWDPHILRLLLAAGMPVPHMFRGQTALGYLLQQHSGSGLSYLWGYLSPLSQLQVRLHCSVHTN